MKKFCLFLLLFLPAVVGANSYPEYINSGKEFIQFADFANLYQGVYEDTNRLDLNEVKERVCEYPEIECETTLSIQNFDELLDAVVVNIKGEKLKQDRLKNYLEQKILLEKRLLDLERTLQRMNSLNVTLTDGDGYEDEKYIQKTSPFEILETLNKVDGLFFGEKMANFYPSFMDKELIPLEDMDFETEADEWLDQTEEMLPPATPFKDTDPSFSSIAQQVMNIFLGDVNPYSLVCTKNTKNLFEYMFCTGPIALPEIAADFYRVPAANTDVPEAWSVLENDFGEFFTGTLNTALIQTDCQSQDIQIEREQNVKLRAGFTEVEYCNRQRSQALEGTIARFLYNTTHEDLDQQYNAYARSLESWRGYLQFFLDYLEIKEERWESINSHEKG